MENTKLVPNANDVNKMKDKIKRYITTVELNTNVNSLLYKQNEPLGNEIQAFKNTYDYDFSAYENEVRNEFKNCYENNLNLCDALLRKFNTTTSRFYDTQVLRLDPLKNQVAISGLMMKTQSLNDEITALTNTLKNKNQSNPDFDLSTIRNKAVENYLVKLYREQDNVTSEMTNNMKIISTSTSNISKFTAESNAIKTNINNMKTQLNSTKDAAQKKLLTQKIAQEQSNLNIKNSSITNADKSIQTAKNNNQFLTQKTNLISTLIFNHIKNNPKLDFAKQNELKTKAKDLNFVIVEDFTFATRNFQRIGVM